MKKLLTGLLVGAIVGVGFTLFCDCYLNSGKDFFAAALERSEQWADKLRSESAAPCYILEGSSDVRMSVDPAAMKDENGLRAVNAGLNAGMGENSNLVEALRMSRPGDILVSFPLAIWQAADNVMSGSAKFLFHRHKFGAFEPGIVDLNAKHLCHLVHGNTFFLFQYFGKALMGWSNIYKYFRVATIHESGWAEVHTYGQNPNRLRKRPLVEKRLRAQACILQMPFVEQKCAEHGLSLIVQIPRSYGDIAWRAQGAINALYLVRQGIRVLKDPALGVETDIACMSDTYQHQNAQGAQPYSRLLARLLADEEYWTEAELVEQLRALGWNEDGTPLATPLPECQDR